jgi:primosomal protein N' (replication factor Y) (superfamily II helicase)
MSNLWAQVWVSTPQYSGVSAALSYRCEPELGIGQLVRVPLGRRLVLGVVVAVSETAPDGLQDKAIKAVDTVLNALPKLNADWCRLIAFAARYYQRSEGEVAMAALPPSLRDLDTVQLDRRLSKLSRRQSTDDPRQNPPPLTTEQAAALAAIEAATQPVLLFGSTGSGKTEVYLQAVAAMLAREPQAQALVLVPEINLTPQLIARFEARFGVDAIAAMHSGLTPAQRLQGWLRAHTGQARMVLGTRMAVFASLPQLRLIVVDEEHDPSYKSQEGARFSARDLAVYRAHGKATGTHCQVVLGSATPSLESWHAALSERYLRVNMSERMGGGALPKLRVVDMQRQPAKTLIAPPLLTAIQTRASRGEQSLLLLNRRGYAPVLSCGSCGWKSQCPHCSAFRVFHKMDRSLRCHHCGLAQPVPNACPECGNLDIEPVGKGTEQLQEQLQALLQGTPNAHGQPLRVGRLDADTARNTEDLANQLAAVHAGEVDVLVGTQMIAKGHDFRRITLVAAVNPDGALYASDFRAPERLFALLMQAGGRAGRDAAQADASELWVQTWVPEHPLFAALKDHDFEGFAQAQLQERQDAQLPPFVHQALMRAEAKSQAQAQAFLNAAYEQVADQAVAWDVTIYPAVPMSMARVANIERAQMLIEAPTRQALQRLLHHWHPGLQTLRQSPLGKGLVRWAIDVDPLAI